MVLFSFFAEINEYVKKQSEHFTVWMHQYTDAV
jgi:hypothetical protein